MATRGAAADDATTAALMRATVLDCRSKAEWLAAVSAAPKKTDVNPWSLRLFCVNARGTRTPTCLGEG
jgi:hypothetical protein